MKITMDKQMTTIDQAKYLKEAMKDFKARYTEADLRRVMADFLDEMGNWEAAGHIGGEILKCEVSAFPSKMTYWENAWYAVDMTIFNYTGYTFLRFYVDQELRLDKRLDLITMRYYGEAKEIF